MEALAQLKWDIGHDPCRAGDRTPLGAIPIGTMVHLRLRVGLEACSRIVAVDLFVLEGDDEWSIPMQPDPNGYGCTVGFRHEPHVAFYRFAITLDTTKTIVYAPCSDSRSSSGEPYEADAAPLGFQVSVYEPNFSTPDWFAGAIMYQVFPDRFARGKTGVRAEGLLMHEKMGRPVHLHEDWNDPVEWEEGREYDPVDFYGGTFEGIREKLPYLASLGVEALYLNPVFEARSNHRYDTADYEHIDPLLGTDGQFSQLAEAASEAGISIILDAVLSHTGSDSRYFNANGTYEEPGAAQGDSSPYYGWYDFNDPDADSPYSCWWGDPTLPEVDERDESWQSYILGSVLPKWISAGARGYRLDVANEIPDDVLERIRTAVKSSKQDAIIIGEVWEDATTKESYGAARTYALGRSLDSVMNYPLRNALLDFATNRIDAYQLATFLKLQQSNYPAPLYRCLMNLMSSHDIERIRTALAYGKSFRNEPRDKQYLIQTRITPGQDARACELQVMITRLLYALPGSPCIYYGDERGMQGGSDPFCRAPMTWGDTIRRDVGQDLLEHYRALGALRKGSPVLRRGVLACTAVNPDAICVARIADEEETVLAFCNRSTETRSLVIDFADLGITVADGACLTCGETTIPVESGLATIMIPALRTEFFTIAE